MNWLEKLFAKLLADAFPVEPVRFAWGPALSPLKTELLALRRKWARDEIKLNDMIEERNRWGGSQYFFDVAFRPWRSQREIDKLTELQDRRERRIGEIIAKLARDSKVKAQPVTKECFEP